MGSIWDLFLRDHQFKASKLSRVRRHQGLPLHQASIDKALLGLKARLVGEKFRVPILSWFLFIAGFSKISSSSSTCIIINVLSIKVGSNSEFKPWVMESTNVKPYFKSRRASRKIVIWCTSVSTILTLLSLKGIHQVAPYSSLKLVFRDKK